jgi:hypothetical protein
MVASVLGVLGPPVLAGEIEVAFEPVGEGLHFTLTLRNDEFCGDETFVVRGLLPDGSSDAACVQFADAMLDHVERMTLGFWLDSPA